MEQIFRLFWNNQNESNSDVDISASDKYCFPHAWDKYALDLGIVSNCTTVNYSLLQTSWCKEMF